MPSVERGEVLAWGGRQRGGEGITVYGVVVMPLVAGAMVEDGYVREVVVVVDNEAVFGASAILSSL